MLIFSSCRNNRAEKELVNLIQEWHGKEIIFPDSLVFTRYATGAAVPFLFFFHPKKIGGVEELYYLLEMYRFELPVCIDRDNKVTVIGNPVYSNEVKELYIKQIQQETEEKQRGEPALDSSQHQASPLQPSTEGEAKDKKKIAFAKQQ
ncbi:MAG: hypothetical protein LBF62_02105 [Tannerellaceae bacterium]|nr:hypothetical protein [Tannerellaceae bacterium]